MPKLKLRSEEKFDSGMLSPTICSCSDSPPPPDTRPMAEASEEAARIGAELGRDQIAESRRQYDLNMEVAKPVIDAQLGIMRETERQGKDYYDYMVANQRPVEAALNADAMAAGSDALLEQRAGEAMADARQGTTAMQNQMIRQGLRYGYSPAKLAAMAGSMSGAQGLSLASAANQARDKERNVGYAKKMDVAGLYRGLPGASQGAYGLALNSGNSAVNNQMQPGNQMLTGMNQGTGTIMQGQGQKIQGLGSILNAQTSMYNAGSGDSGLGGMLGMLGSAAINKWSDRRLKEDIVPLAVHEATGLPLYEFSYRGDPARRRFVGVMADEVEKVMPEAVIYTDAGFAAVNYGMLGIEFKEVSNHG